MRGDATGTRIGGPKHARRCFLFSRRAASLLAVRPFCARPLSGFGLPNPPNGCQPPGADLRSLRARLHRPPVNDTWAIGRPLWFMYSPFTAEDPENSTRPPRQPHPVFTKRELSFFCALAEWD